MKKWLQKASNFCVYQERSHKEMREKLLSWGATYDEIDYTLTWLIENNFLNEGRFAEQYAGGKFRVNKWGKRKIAFELKKRGLSENNIKIALLEISDEDYYQTIQDLIERKSNDLKHKESGLVLKQKIVRWLISRGYEPDLIYDFLNSNGY